MNEGLNTLEKETNNIVLWYAFENVVSELKMVNYVDNCSYVSYDEINDCYCFFNQFVEQFNCYIDLLIDDDKETTVALSIFKNKNCLISLSTRRFDKIANIINQTIFENIENEIYI
jgi:hypothetical protein